MLAMHSSYKRISSSLYSSKHHSPLSIDLNSLVCFSGERDSYSCRDWYSTYTAYFTQCNSILPPSDIANNAPRSPSCRGMEHTRGQTEKIPYVLLRAVTYTNREGSAHIGVHIIQHTDGIVPVQTNVATSELNTVRKGRIQIQRGQRGRKEHKGQIRMTIQHDLHVINAVKHYIKGMAARSILRDNCHLKKHSTVPVVSHNFGIALNEIHTKRWWG